MKMKTFLPLAAVLCAFTCFVGCGEAPAPAEEAAAPAAEATPAPAPAPEVVVKELMRTFSTALLNGDTETLNSCVLEEDQQMAAMMAGMMAMASEEDKAEGMAEMEAYLAKITILIEGDKAYSVVDGKREPGHFAVLVDGAWKIDMPAM